jgi:hypothetical protein
MDESEEIEYEYQGRPWTFPRPLAQLQIALAQADADCRRHLDDPEQLEAARAKRLDLILEKYRLAQPWWNSFKKHDRWHADWALQDYAHRTTELDP